MSEASKTESIPDPIAFIAKPTSTLRATITQQQGILPAADFAGLISVVRSVFQKYTNKLLEFEPGTDRADVLHMLIDREIATGTAQVKVSCRQGCCGCCHYEVEVTRDEAALLAAAVRAGCEVDRERLKVQAARERRSPKWFEFWSADNRCVFLGEEGTCRVYDNRPASCRKHLVMNPPEACTTIGATLVPLQLMLVEILLSAAMSIPDTPFASLSKMLLPELEGGAATGR
jgi:Fe-S-cluster containining protein